MRRTQLLAALLAAAAVAPVALQAQTLSQPTLVRSSAPTLQTFTPIDSLFVNSSATSFNIALVHTMTGTATEYRVSRFADFRDANWIPYASRPSVVVPHAWFVNVGTNGEQETTLHFQLRARNPMGGRPASFQPGGPVQVQPDFFFSEVKVGHIRLVFVG